MVMLDSAYIGIVRKTVDWLWHRLKMRSEDDSAKIFFEIRLEIIV